MTFLNSMLRGLTDLVLAPLRGAPPFVSLVLFSLVAAVGALLVYKRFSNQQAISAVKDKMAASFFEIRLFNDDLRAIGRSQLDLLRANGRYLALNMLPFVVMLVPMVFLIAQLQFYYGYRGFDVAEAAVVSLTLDGTATAAQPAPEVELRAPDGVRIATPAVWIPSKNQMAWRIEGERAGRYELEFSLPAGASCTKTLVVSDGFERRSPLRHRGNFFDQVLYPAERTLASDTTVHSITLNYPEAEIEVFGFGFHWLIWFFVLSIVFAFALRGWMGVTF